MDTLQIFLGSGVSDLTPEQVDDLEAFMIAFESDLTPIVGQQLTLTPALLVRADAAAVNARVDLLVERAGTAFSSQILGGVSTECDLIAHMLEGGSQPVGYLLNAGGSFTPDDGSAAIGEAVLRAKAGVALSWLLARRRRAAAVSVR